jgi:hypothetical protein
MKFQATNSNGIGNRFRCFLAALRMSEDSTIYWNPKLEDRVTKPEEITGTVDPLESLIETDKSIPLQEDAWQIPKFSYFTLAKESGNRSLFCLYENMDPRAKRDYLKLKDKYLKPTEAVKKLAIPGFKIGFQIRSKSELILPPKDMTHPSILKFLDEVHYPVFVAADSKELSDRVSQNPNVFVFTNPHKYDFDMEWNWSFAEILTMSSCETLYITPGSTYGEMGYLFGDYKPRIRSCIHPVVPTDLKTLKKPSIIV